MQASARPIRLAGTSRVVLDLDDTLYLERDFVRSGFLAVAAAVRVHDGRPDFFERAWALFRQGCRGNVFNRVLGPDASAETVAELVSIYRCHRPDIALTPDAARFLAALPAQVSLGLISDGPEAQQTNKLEALGLLDRFDSVVLTGAWGSRFSKPHPRAFVETMRRLGGRPHDYVYVADNPAKDFIQPRKLGWRTVRVRRKKGLYAAEAGVEAEREVQTLDELLVI